MRKSALIFSIICLTVTGCANDKAAERLARERRALEDLRRELEDSKRQLEAQMFGFGRKPDLSGRAGPISLMGAMVQTQKSTVPRVSITYIGPNTEREYPALTKKARPGLELDETDSTYINMGCKNLDRPELKGLRPGEQEGEAFAFASARVILICGTPPLGIVSTELVASRVILEDANLLVEGTNYSHFAIRANELTLNGNNTIRTRAVPAAHGPILFVSNVFLRGEGHLAIESEAYSGPPVEPER